MISLSNYQLLSSNFKHHQYFDKNVQLLKDINVDAMWEAKFTGKDMRIGIIDTGIDVDHIDLKDRIIDGIFTAKTFGESSNSIQDTVGHGTHVAGLIGACKNIHGIAPDADLYIVKAFRDNGTTSVDAIVKGIMWLIEKGVHVISMSLGAQREDSQLKMATMSAASKGIIVSCASGNDRMTTPGEMSTDYPAIYDHTVSVGAIDFSDKIANFSSVGTVDTVANGVQVPSTYLKGSYALMSGTSMAQPQMAGAMTLIQQKSLHMTGKPMSLQQMKSYIAMNSIDLGPKGKDHVYGYGAFRFPNL